MIVYRHVVCATRWDDQAELSINFAGLVHKTSKRIRDIVDRLQMYTGKNSEVSTHEQGLSTRGNYCKARRVPNAKCIRCMWITITPASPHLFLSLYEKKVGACATIRTNRKYELVVSASSVERGYMIIDVVRHLLQVYGRIRG